MTTIKQLAGILLLVLFCSCEGPEGPEGPQGTQGIQGTKGNDGNANVTSDEYTIATSDWITQTDFLYYQVYPTFITDDIVDNGFVKVFFSTNGTDWLPLPYIYFDASGDIVRYDYLYETELVEIRIKTSSGTIVDPGQSITVKVIAIAGNAYALNPQIKTYGYSEFKNAFPSAIK